MGSGRDKRKKAKGSQAGQGGIKTAKKTEKNDAKANRRAEKRAEVGFLQLQAFWHPQDMPLDTKTSLIQSVP